MESGLYFGRLPGGFHQKPAAKPLVWTVYLTFLLGVAACRGEPGADWTEAISRAPWAAREGQAGAVLQGKLWILGGGEAGEKPNRNDVWYSADGVDWSQAAPTAPWRARRHHVSVAFKERIWVLGGLSYDEVEKRNVYLNDIWSSSNGIAWTPSKAVVPWSGRCHHTAVVCHDRIWLIGGENSGGEMQLSDVWSSNDGEHWVAVTDSAPWGGRSYHASTVHHGQDHRRPFEHDPARRERGQRRRVAGTHAISGKRGSGRGRQLRAGAGWCVGVQRQSLRLR